MHELLKELLKKVLLSYNIDIHDKYFKSSENYQKIKNTRIKVPFYGGMFLEEYIERFLLTENEVSNTYESIYDLGAKNSLRGKCEDIDVAKEILTTTQLIDECDIDAEAVELVNSFNRPGGLIERLKKHCDFDLNAFDKNNEHYKYERCKIIYFFYMLEKMDFPKTNILQLLSKPSMENIDNSTLNVQTYNGEKIKLIRESLGKELSLPMKTKIKTSVEKVVTFWDQVITNAFRLMDFFSMNKCEYDFNNTIQLLSPGSLKYDEKNAPQYTLSPIATLYLKISQHEYLGNIMDISKQNNIQNNYINNVPPEYVEEMKKLHFSVIDVNNIEQYIDDNAKQISRYVYLKENTSKEQVRKIRDCKHKIPKFIDFCIRAKPLLNIKEGFTELQIISFLQAVILDDQSETFPYTFYGYQNHIKHMPQVQGALKNDKPVLDALKIYWTRKAVDHWYADLGRLNERNNLKKLEQACDHILIEILSKPNLKEMEIAQNHYLNNLDDELITTSEQLNAVQNFISDLKYMGFNYIDHSYAIRHAFLYPPEIKKTYTVLFSMIKMTIKNCEQLLQIDCELSSANGKDSLIFCCELSFDYEEHLCSMQYSKLGTVHK